jgi:excisionase family DNA binding protein
VPVDRPAGPSPIVWKTVAQAADHANVGPRTIYNEIKAGRLRAARVGGRREYRLLDSWVNDWLIQSATPVVVR